MRRGLCAALAALWAVGIGTSAQGALIGLPQIFPDITVQTVKVIYNGGTGAFSLTGTTSAFDRDGVAPLDYSGSAITSPKAFSLTATLDTADGDLLGGSFTVGGKIPTLTPTPANSGTLLTGTLTQFGFQDGGGILFDFKFNVSGGDLAPYFYGPGPNSFGGIKLTATNGSGSDPFNGDFSNSFTNTTSIGTGGADIFVAPEPAAALLLVLSGAALFSRRAGRGASK